MSRKHLPVVRSTESDPDDAPTWTAIRRRRTAPPPVQPRVVREGRSGRVELDADALPENESLDELLNDDRFLRICTPAEAESAPFSSYDVATHGPKPAPDWLVTSLNARDTRLGVLKTGKEADVSLLDRSVPGGEGCLLAVKTFRDSNHRMFHRDATYQEGRRTRRSRETRAMANRSSFGRELLSGKWAAAEFSALSRLWQAGARVPYPVQLMGTEVMMEFVGDPDGSAAPRLAAYNGEKDDFVDLWHHLVHTLELLAEEGLTHGDLSAYNVLVADGECVLIDLPQVVDVVTNPQGTEFLERDCRNIAEFFTRRGVHAADGERLALHLGSIANR